MKEWITGKIAAISRTANLFAAFGNLLIMIVASLAAAHVLRPSNQFLAILIAWANLCAAIHRTHSHYKNGDTPP